MQTTFKNIVQEGVIAQIVATSLCASLFLTLFNNNPFTDEGFLNVASVFRVCCYRYVIDNLGDTIIILYQL